MLTAKQRVNKVKLWVRTIGNNLSIATAYDEVEGVTLRDCTKCSLSSVDENSVLAAISQCEFEQKKNETVAGEVRVSDTIESQKQENILSTLEKENTFPKVRVYENKRKPSWKRFIRTPCSVWNERVGADVRRKRRGKISTKLDDIFEKLDLNEIKETPPKSNSKRKRGKKEHSVVENTPLTEHAMSPSVTEEDQQHSSDPDWENKKDIDLDYAFVKSKQRFKKKLSDGLQTKSKKTSNCKLDKKTAPKRRKLEDNYVYLENFDVEDESINNADKKIENIVIDLYDKLCVSKKNFENSREKLKNLESDRNGDGMRIVNRDKEEIIKDNLKKKSNDGVGNCENNNRKEEGELNIEGEREYKGSDMFEVCEIGGGLGSGIGENVAAFDVLNENRPSIDKDGYLTGVDVLEDINIKKKVINVTSTNEASLIKNMKTQNGEGDTNKKSESFDSWKSCITDNDENIGRIRKIGGESGDVFEDLQGQELEKKEDASKEMSNMNKNENSEAKDKIIRENDGKCRQEKTRNIYGKECVKENYLIDVHSSRVVFENPSLMGKDAENVLAFMTIVKQFNSGEDSRNVAQVPATVSEGSENIAQVPAITNKESENVAQLPDITNTDPEDVPHVQAITSRGFRNIAQEPTIRSTDSRDIANVPAIPSENSRNIAQLPDITISDSEDVANLPAISRDSRNIAQEPNIRNTHSRGVANIPAITSRDPKHVTQKSAVSSRDSKDVAHVPTISSKNSKNNAQEPAISNRYTQNVAKVPEKFLQPEESGQLSVIDKSPDNNNLIASKVYLIETEKVLDKNAIMVASTEKNQESQSSEVQSGRIETPQIINVISKKADEESRRLRKNKDMKNAGSKKLRSGEELLSEKNNMCELDKKHNNAMSRKIGRYRKLKIKVLKRCDILKDDNNNANVVQKRIKKKIFSSRIFKTNVSASGWLNIQDRLKQMTISRYYDKLNISGGNRLSASQVDGRVETSETVCERKQVKNSSRMKEPAIDKYGKIKRKSRGMHNIEDSRSRAKRKMTLINDVKEQSRMTNDKMNENDCGVRNEKEIIDENDPKKINNDSSTMAKKGSSEDPVLVSEMDTHPSKTITDAEHDQDNIQANTLSRIINCSNPKSKILSDASEICAEMFLQPSQLKEQKKLENNKKLIMDSLDKTSNKIITVDTNSIEKTQACEKSYLETGEENVLNNINNCQRDEEISQPLDRIPLEKALNKSYQNCASANDSQKHLVQVLGNTSQRNAGVSKEVTTEKDIRDSTLPRHNVKKLMPNYFNRSCVKVNVGKVGGCGKKETLENNFEEKDDEVSRNGQIICTEENDEMHRLTVQEKLSTNEFVLDERRLTSNSVHGLVTTDKEEDKERVVINNVKETIRKDLEENIGERLLITDVEGNFVKELGIINNDVEGSMEEENVATNIENIESGEWFVENSIPLEENPRDKFSFLRILGKSRCNFDGDVLKGNSTGKVCNSYQECRSNQVKMVQTCDVDDDDDDKKTGNANHEKLLQEDEEEFSTDENLRSIDVEDCEDDIRFTSIEIQLKGELIGEFCGMLEEFEGDERFNLRLLKCFINHLRGRDAACIAFDAVGNVFVDGVEITQKFGGTTNEMDSQNEVDSLGEVCREKEEEQKQQGRIDKSTQTSFSGSQCQKQGEKFSTCDDSIHATKSRRSVEDVCGGSKVEQNSCSNELEENVEDVGPKNMSSSNELKKPVEDVSFSGCTTQKSSTNDLKKCVEDARVSQNITSNDDLNKMKKRVEDRCVSQYIITPKSCSNTELNKSCASYMSRILLEIAKRMESEHVSSAPDSSLQVNEQEIQFLPFMLKGMLSTRVLGEFSRIRMLKMET